MDKNNKKHAADMNTTNKKADNRTEFADEINMKDTQANKNKQNNK